VVQQLSDKFIFLVRHENNAAEYVKLNSISDEIVSVDERFAYAARYANPCLSNADTASNEQEEHFE
jgi:hypothetical protein